MIEFMAELMLHALGSAMGWRGFVGILIIGLIGFGIAYFTGNV